MANFRLNADKAIFDVLNVEALHDLAAGGVFNTIAPQGTALPFVVYQFISKVDTHSFDGRYADSMYLVKAIADSPWPKPAEDIDTQIDTLMEDAALSITGFNLLYCRRESDFWFPEDRSGKTLTHVGGTYRIMADQT
tara:strand:+ start:9152 stop:9562 length:411 start_codon:yes stop_codon:yes gene_type:complete